MVDMGALINFLVTKLGSNQIIDPITREDTVWQLLDFLAKDKEFFDASQMFPNSSTSIQDIAAYLKNHLRASSSLEKTFDMA